MKGKSYDPNYSIWHGMIHRCNNHPQYVSRGITVCDRWVRSFDAFMADMGPRPSRRYSIDRIDNNGNYEPGNCRWATKKQQARNRSNAVTVEYKGEMRLLAELIEGRGIPLSVVTGRIRRGWSVRDAINMPRIIGYYKDRKFFLKNRKKSSPGLDRD